MPTISFANNLDSSVLVYDSFDKQDSSNQDSGNYFGTLTLLATVPAHTTARVQYFHTVSVLIVSNATTNIPVARLIASTLFGNKLLSVGPADVEAMAQTMDFITFIIQNPSDVLTTTFLNIMKDTSKSPVQPVTHFFAQHEAYAKCTFVTYMMSITIAAEQPESKGKPLDQAVYSLSQLAKLLGGDWPADFPDIVLTKFTCDTQNDVLAIRGEIDLSKLPAQSDQALQFFGSLFDVHLLQVAVHFNYGFNIGALGTRLAIGLDALHVPFGQSASLTINKPTVTVDINPLFKFVVFTVTGSIPFSIFGKAFETDVSMLIDNLEASFGVVIKGDNSSLPAPSMMQDVHFDEFGVGIGVFFEPPGAAIGLSGKFHIGDPGSGSQVALDDDTFVVVCQLIEEVPNPLYISFYVPQMHLTDVLTVFTNVQTTLDVPVSFTNLSFKWSENPMEPVALPDGSLSNMGYGFSAAAKILVFSFYGDIEINLTNGLTADIEMSPLTLGSIFSIGGDGIGFSINVDSAGNPIKNNQLATTAAQQQALRPSSTKQLVAPGGPVLKLQTFASPFLHLNGHVSLFEVDNAQLDADITNSGIIFQVDFGPVLTSSMSCSLTDYHNLAATFQFGIDQTISLPSMGGTSLGSIPLQATAGAHLSLSTSSSDIILLVGGSFDFEGTTRIFADFTVDAPIQKVSDLLSAIVSHIQQIAGRLFSDLLNDGRTWAGKVKQGVITAADLVASVLHNAFGQDADQVASTMQAVGYDANEAAEQLQSVFNPTQVANALKTAFGLLEQDVAQVMRQAGYTGEVVAQALKDTFGDDAEAIASALQVAFGLGPDQIHQVLSGIGFGAQQIGQAFKDLGGDFAQATTDILNAGCVVM